MNTKIQLFAILVLVTFPASVLAQATSIINPKIISLRHAPDIITPSGKVINGRALEAAEDAQADKLWAIFCRGKADLSIDDYSDAAINFRKAIACASIDDPCIDYKQHLAYAMLGAGDKTAAFKLLRNSLYYGGRNLYTSGFRLKPYMTYALLEDEAGNWKEAALAYNLAGGGPNGKISESEGPNVPYTFSLNRPEFRQLAAAANVMLGTLSWDAHFNDTGNAALSDALAYMRTATNLEPKWPVGWFYRYRVLKAAKHPHQATEAYHRAVSLAGSVDKLGALGCPPPMQQPTITTTKQ